MALLNSILLEGVVFGDVKKINEKYLFSILYGNDKKGYPIKFEVEARGNLDILKKDTPIRIVGKLHSDMLTTMIVAEHVEIKRLIL